MVIPLLCVLGLLKLSPEGPSLELLQHQKLMTHCKSPLYMYMYVCGLVCYQIGVLYLYMS